MVEKAQRKLKNSAEARKKAGKRMEVAKEVFKVKEKILGKAKTELQNEELKLKQDHLSYSFIWLRWHLMQLLCTLLD